MKILAALLVIFLHACGTVGDADAQQINEIKTDRLLVGPSTGATAFLSVNRSTQLIMQQTGNFTGSGGTVMGFYQSPTLITGQGLNAYGTWMNPVMTKAGAGAHPDVATLTLSPPTINGGAATVTTAETLNIIGPPTGAGTNRTIWAKGGGLSEFTGTAGTGFQFLTITGTTSGFQYMDMINSSGRTIFGMEGAGGGQLIGGAAPYSTVLEAATNENLIFGTNGTIRMTIDNAGTVTINNGGAANAAVCWKADGITLGHCTSAVGAGGTCTCA